MLDQDSAHGIRLLTLTAQVAVGIPHRSGYCDEKMATWAGALDTGKATYLVTVSLWPKSVM